MSPWPSGISLFASSVSPCSGLTCFGDFTVLWKKKRESEREGEGWREGRKKVIPATAWIRKRESEEKKKKKQSG